MTAFRLRSLLVAALATLAHSALASAQLPPTDTPTPQFPVPAASPIPTPPPPPATGAARWFDPATAPFIPVPEVGTDPNSGTTLGIMPVWLRTDQDHNIDQIIAPDIL